MQISLLQNSVCKPTLFLNGAVIDSVSTASLLL